MALLQLMFILPIHDASTLLASELPCSERVRSMNGIIIVIGRQGYCSRKRTNAKPCHHRLFLLPWTASLLYRESLRRRSRSYRRFPSIDLPLGSAIGLEVSPRTRQVFVSVL